MLSRSAPCPAPTLSPPTAWQGYGYGLLGVLIFSLTLPMTRVAVTEMSPWLISLGRAWLAAVPAILMLVLTRSRRPTREEWPAVILAALGVVIGWPLTSTFALTTVSSSHGAVFNGLLPLCTAMFAAWRSGERPPRAFWAWAGAGAVLVMVYGLQQGAGRFQAGDVWLLVAVVLGGMGYAEGARASRTLGGARTICWALAISAPILTVPVMLLLRDAAATTGWPGMPVIGAFAYLAFGSMFLGFFAWYRGLAIGGIARVGQVQLLQPFLTVLAAATLFHESVEPSAFVFAVAVILVIAGGRRAMLNSAR
ncbi:DMT family transporter [Bordetella sp. 02P26C-1]|uniref:DMT family transporter n=1 Tax=Bordetella sp. 02P26C-1 TaxID=2683195 RepID=UPI0013525176|nr:DMT family transporter [Bordetella sp. 02P26C-1]MVW79124.1 EamA family transporter [Bordetella sp. 02P26C-1]